MNLTSSTMQPDLWVNMKDGIHEHIVVSVNEAIDRGITRIKRNNIITELFKQLLNYAAITSVTEEANKQFVIDTVCCRFTITWKGPHKYIVTIEGNDELTAAINIECNGQAILVNRTELEFQSMVVMLTSLVLKNSQDSNVQYVEVLTTS